MNPWASAGGTGPVVAPEKPEAEPAAAPGGFSWTQPAVATENGAAKDAKEGDEAKKPDNSAVVIF